MSHGSTTPTPRRCNCRVSYSYAIAVWLTECRLSHQRVCPCGRFRDHWYQDCLSENQSVSTQTEWPPVSQPIAVPHPPSEPRKPTGAKAATSRPSTTRRRPARLTETSATSSGNPPGEQLSAPTTPVRQSGGRRGPRRRLRFTSERSGTGYTARRNVYNPPAIPTEPDSDDLSVWDSDFENGLDEDLMSVTEEGTGAGDGDSDAAYPEHGTPPSTDSAGTPGRSGPDSAGHSSTLTRALTQYAGATHTTSSALNSRGSSKFPWEF